MARGDKKKEEGVETVTGDPETDASKNRERIAKSRPLSEVARAQYGPDNKRNTDDDEVDRLTQTKFGAATWRDAIEAKKKEEKGKSNKK